MAKALQELYAGVGATPPEPVLNPASLSVAQVRHGWSNADRQGFEGQIIPPPPMNGTPISSPVENSCYVSDFSLFRRVILPKFRCL